MSVPFYAKSPENQGYIKNMEVVGFCDLNGVNAFQMALHKTDDGRYYMYCGSFRGPGWNVVDVTDPTQPKVVNWLEACDPKEYPATNTPKIQVADGLMIGATGGGVSFLHGCKPGDKSLGSLQIFDIKTDPVHPKLLGKWETGVENGMGVHRFFYNGGRYVHLSADCPGYTGNIYRILDIIDPTHPVEVGRWWVPCQFTDGLKEGEYPVDGPQHWEFMDWPQLHGPPFVVGNLAYLSYYCEGLIILDISDITRPKKIGQLQLKGPFSGKFAGARTHTCLPLPGRNFLVATNEGERFPFYNKEILTTGPRKGAQPMNNLHMIDISDPTDPQLVAEFPYPEVPENYPWPNFNTAGMDGAQGPFGPHNIHEPMSNKPWLDQNPNRVYCCYFHAGMRVYDVSDPYYIKELAYFIPPNPEKLLFDIPVPGPMLATTEDCVVDDRGYIYMDTWHDGMYTLGDRKTALFLIMSDTDTTFNFVIAMLQSQLFNLLCDKADDVYGGRLPVHVRCLLDEFANIGQIPNFDKLIATIRSREISASIILQSQSQLKTIYKDAADTIVGNCDTTLFLGGKEKSTLKEISELLGKETIDSFNQSENRGSQVSHGLNYQKLGKELMTQDEIAVMDGGKCILQLRGVRPFFSDKYDITKHPKYKYLSDADPQNAFDVEKYRKRRPALPKPDEVFDYYEIDATDLPEDTEP